MKQGLLISLIVVAVVILATISWVVSSYNGLVNMDEESSRAWANVETAYQRRADLIPNLIETVKGARDYEESVLTEITSLRSQAGQAKINVDSATSPSQLQAAAGQMDSVLSRLLVVVERYPDLKATENFLSLQDELAGTENRIKVERDNYNKAVKNYNVKVRRFPSNIIAGMFGFDRKESFSADAGAENAPAVSFN